ncbi:hypothetical protein [Nitrosophilus kaiyonis]|uniref:hypothetical protein n=1 Tax=Nitrosophilus kaiyonis TaxID=2930200 RepID=UPI0024938A49|nr:hypothetical protein [Nitrosophilus kaiyonis]
MELYKILNDSSYIAISGNSGTGKLTFASWLIKNAFDEKAIIFSSQYENILIKKINILHKNFDNFKDLYNHLDIFTIKPDWKDIKEKYSFLLFIEEIEKIIKESSAKNIIFHRFSQFFENMDLNDIEFFIKNLTDIIQKYQKRVFVLLNKENPLYEMIEENLYQFIDINFDVKNFDNFSKNISIKYSLFPLKENEFYFKIDKNRFKLITKKNEKIVTKKNILVFTKDEYLSKLHSYIFDNNNFINLTIENDPLKILEEFLKNPDITIYHSEDIDVQSCKFLKESPLNTQILLLLEKKFIRTEDKINAINNGCSDITTYYNLSDYIFLLEKSLENSFYSNKKIEINVNYFKEKKDFLEVINLLIKKRLFFTIFQFKYNQNLHIDDLINRLRKYDRVFFDKKEKKLYLLMLNFQKNNYEILENKFSDFKDYLLLGKSFDSLDIFYQKAYIFS